MPSTLLAAYTSHEVRPPYISASLSSDFVVVTMRGPEQDVKRFPGCKELGPTVQITMSKFDFAKFCLDSLKSMGVIEISVA